MTTITYDQVLQMTQQLSLIEQLRLLESVSLLVRQQVEKEHSLLDLEGTGIHVWQTDAQAFVNEERETWDS